MSDPTQVASPTADQPSPEEKKKKKDKVQAAWISFVGRILAQVLGAVATVTLGLFVLQRHGKDDGRAAPAADAAARPARVATPRPAGEVALAVLPLDNFSGDPKQDYFADGMTEALIADLAQIDGLRVISRTSSMNVKREGKSIPQVAQELSVDLVVEGSVVKAGDRVRVTAQLIDAKTDEHLWARSYDRTLRDVLTLQGEIAATIAREVKGALPGEQQERLARKRLVDPEIYDLYLRGRHAWNRRTPADLQEAVRYFDQALQKDPQFALAHAGLADAYGLMPPSATPDAATKAKRAARRAIELDDSLAEAHTALGGVLHRADWDREAAEREFRRALELNPGYITAHQWYAILLAEEGRDADALRHAERAVALDPLSGLMHQALGLIHLFGRRFDRAVAEERRALDLAPQLGLAPQFLAHALVAQGKATEAIAVAERASPANERELLAILGSAYIKAGDRARAETIRRRLLAQKPVPTTALAQWHAAAGESDTTFAMLERSLSDQPGSLRSLKVDPLFDGVRNDPRFADITRRAGL